MTGSVARIEKGTPEFVAFVRAGVHRLMCCPGEFITEGPREKIGRIHWREDLLPAFGQTEGEHRCLCWDRTITVNGAILE